MKLLIRWLIRGYQVLISPLLHWIGGPGSGCRFHPTCSEYMLQAVELHGVFRGIWLGLKRLGRCHPWGGHGEDPVPSVKQSKSSTLHSEGKCDPASHANSKKTSGSCHGHQDGCP